MAFSLRTVYVCGVSRITMCALRSRTCAVQRLLSASLVLVENKALSPSRVSHRLAHTSRVGVVSDCWCVQRGPLLLSSLCTTILSPWPRRHGQCVGVGTGVSGLSPCSQTHTHSHKTRPLFSASDSIATPESLFRSLVTFTTQISSRRLGVAGLASHCLACSQSDSVWCMHAGTCATAVSPDDENEILFSALADTSRRLTAACMQRSHAPCTGWRGTRGERLSYLAQIKAAVPALVGDHQVERD